MIIIFEIIRLKIEREKIIWKWMKMRGDKRKIKLKEGN